MEKGELRDYRIKFAISRSPQDDPILRSLAAIAMRQGMQVAMKHLAEWYEEQNRKLFMLSVKKDLPMEGVDEILASIQETVGKLDIDGLPYLALNGYEITPTIFWAKVEWD